MYFRHLYIDCSGQYKGFRLAKGRLYRDRMLVGFTTTYTISAYHNLCPNSAHSDVY